MWSQCRLQLAFSLSPLWSVLHGATNYLLRTSLWLPVCFSLSTCNSCHSLQNGTVTAWHRKPFTDCFSPVFTPAAAASISSPHPAHWTCIPTPAPVSHRPHAIVRMFRAPSQLYFAAHVDFCPSLQAREHFFLITIVFHIVIYGSFSGLVLNTLFPFLPS